MIIIIKNTVLKIKGSPLIKKLEHLLKSSLFLHAKRNLEKITNINFIKAVIRKISNTSILEGFMDSIDISFKWSPELLGFKKGGDEFLEYFIKLCNLNPSEKVLEVGCGIGRMAVSLTKYLTTGSYEGFDIVDSGINWCNKKIASQFPNFHFIKADLYNHTYNPGGKYQASEYRFPYDDKSFDFVFLTSVFTHMLPKEVENYLSEISRVLKRNGRCLITFFLLNAESIKAINTKLSKHNFIYKYKGFRAINKNNLEDAIAYDESLIRSFYEKYGLSIIEPIHYGNWSNRQNALSHQDIISAIKTREVEIA